MVLKHGNQKNENIAAEVQNAYDFLRQGSDMLPTSEVELCDRFYEMLQSLEWLKEEVERTLE
tara:strand:- start:30 stop:215 length:186 start_codon:yes stop_codon:yes gene_type:complete